MATPGQARAASEAGQAAIEEPAGASYSQFVDPDGEYLHLNRLVDVLELYAMLQAGDGERFDAHFDNMLRQNQDPGFGDAPRPLTQLELEAPEAGRLTSHASLDQHTLVLKLSGAAEIPDKARLSELLRRVHEVAIGQSLSKVNVDLWDLVFMNSSCFKDFVSWISVVQDMPATNQYKISFKSNPQLRWQRGSLHALSCFGVDIVAIE